MIKKKKEIVRSKAVSRQEEEIVRSKAFSRQEEAVEKQRSITNSSPAGGCSWHLSAGILATAT